MSSYCEFVKKTSSKEVDIHLYYHDHVYGFPLEDDNELFGRLVLEMNQAGLNWLTMLKKQDNFRNAYSGFDIASIAYYGDEDRERLLNDEGIIRNKLKINAVIHNAGVIVELQKEFGSFYSWLRSLHPKTKEEWTKLFKKKFKFTGGEIVSSFLLSIGFLEGAHDEDCPVYGEILPLNPVWRQT